jgi:lipoyl(octanoyl) transferase
MSFQGQLAYPVALRQMEARRAGMIAGDLQGQLILCEHSPVITCGRSSHAENLLLSTDERKRRGIALVEIARGGDLTYHGPGQLMVYPIVRVGVAVSAFLETIASVLSELARSYGVTGAHWRRDEPGVWIGERKLAACGLHIQRGVSIHGFSFNVSTPPTAWHCIVPCGLAGPSPISLAEALPPGRPTPTVAEVAERALPLLREALLAYGLDPNTPNSLD